MVEEAKVMEVMEPQPEARPPEGVLEVVGASTAEGVGVDPNVEDPKEEDVTTPIRKLPINCHFLSSKKISSQKIPKNRSQLLLLPNYNFFEIPTTGTTTSKFTGHQYLFSFSEPQAAKKDISKNIIISSWIQKQKFPQDPTWVSSKKKKIFCLINL